MYVCMVIVIVIVIVIGNCIVLYCAVLYCILLYCIVRNICIHSIQFVACGNIRVPAGFTIYYVRPLWFKKLPPMLERYPSTVPHVHVVHVSVMALELDLGRHKS